MLVKHYQSYVPSLVLSFLELWLLCVGLGGGHNSNLCHSLVSDVISIDKTGENFRLIYDTKGRFAVHRITPEEAKVIIGSRLGLHSSFTLGERKVVEETDSP